MLLNFRDLVQDTCLFIHNFFSHRPSTYPYFIYVPNLIFPSICPIFVFLRACPQLYFPSRIPLTVLSSCISIEPSLLPHLDPHRTKLTLVLHHWLSLRLHTPSFAPFTSNNAHINILKSSCTVGVLRGLLSVLAPSASSTLTLPHTVRYFNVLSLVPSRRYCSLNSFVELFFVYFSHVWLLELCRNPPHHINPLVLDNSTYPPVPFLASFAV